MTQHQTRHYQQIEAAIRFIQANFKSQPSLDEVAAAVHLSPFHFQRLFSDWAGVSPKKFIQYISLEYAKKQLLAGQSLQGTAVETGFSGSGRLHDLFINLEGMTPGEYKNGAQALSINHSFADSPFGPVLVASTPKGVCHLAFAQQKHQAIATLVKRFPKATFQQQEDALQQQAVSIFKQDWQQLKKIKLHLSATPFQLKVWQSLLKIPPGHLSSYGQLAYSIGKPKASRAVGTAIGLNPVAFLIPCHRVIRASGELGGYHWGSPRKAAIIAWEAATCDENA